MSATPTKITVSPKQEAPKVVEAPVKKAARARAKAKVTTVVVEPTVVATTDPATDVAPTEGMVEEVQKAPKVKRSRPKTRNFLELYGQIKASLDLSYKELQNAHRLFASLENAHKRELSTPKTRESSHRTATIVFDAELVAYYRARLEPAERVVFHKEGNGKVQVQLDELSTETRVHRTDMTQLFNLIFKKHNLQDPADGRNVLYQQDPELVKLLVSNHNPTPSLAEEIAQINAGTYQLTIFNIQRFVSHHLSKVPVAVPVQTVAPTTN